MTPDEAIRRFERRMPGVTMRGTRELYGYAIEALREKLERSKGCVWCKEDNKVYHDGQHFHFFCSYCGKRLEVEHEN